MRQALPPDSPVSSSRDKLLAKSDAVNGSSDGAHGLDRVQSKGQPSSVMNHSTPKHGKDFSFRRGDTMRAFGDAKKPATARRASAVFSLAAGSVMKNAGHAKYSDATSSWVFFPNNPYYMGWWYFTVVVAVLNAWFTPFSLAFSQYPGLYPIGDLDSIVDILSFAVFTADIWLKFHTAYFNPRTNQMVTDLPTIRSNYIRGLFWIDLLSTFPFDVPIMFAMGLNASDSNLARYICLLKLFRLIRLYRLFEFFDYVEYNMILGQITLMLIRNITYVTFVTHWAGCLIWFVARSEYFSPTGSWVGRQADRFADVSLTTQYIYSWYMMMASFTGMGDNDFYSNSPYESTFMIVYQIVCLVLGAYILGSVTLLVVKGDERAAVLRSRLEAIKNYAGVNDMPDDLMAAMVANMELHFHVELHSDEIMLHSMPTTIRRRILRHLYDQQLRECYLFSGCSTKFLDAVLFAGRIEDYMAGVQIVSPGDVLNELHVIMSGSVATMATCLDPNARGVSLVPFEDQTTRNVMRDGLQTSGSLVLRPVHQITLSTSQTFGEVSFFTELPIVDPATTVSVCKIMLVSRSAYAGLEARFPDDVRLVLENMRGQITLQARHELLMASRESQIKAAATRDLQETLMAGGTSSKSWTSKQKEQERLVLDTLNPLQRSALICLRSVEAHVSKYCTKLDKERVTAMLHAASTGDDVEVQRLLGLGLDVDSADSDGRTALMLAVQKGNKDVVLLLLEAGAETDRRCALGFTALFLACKHGHDLLALKLLECGAALNMEPRMLASELRDSAVRGDLALMRRLLDAGTPADLHDYSTRRTALHISAAEGNLQAVKLLVEEGEATVDLQDHWGNTALGEARRVGAAGVVAYLESLTDKAQDVEGTARWRQLRTASFLSACGSGDVGRIRSMLEGSAPPALATGFMLASAHGHKAAVALLQAWVGADVLSRSVSQTALVEAACGRQDEVAALLISNSGASLSSLPTAAGAALLAGAVAENAAGTLRLLLQAGLEAEAPQGGGGASRRTALHTAAELGHLIMLRILVEEGGARHNVKDEAGRTPLDAARATAGGGDTAVLEYLEWATASSAGTGGTAGETVGKAQANLRFGLVRSASSKLHHSSSHHLSPRGGSAGGADAANSSAQRLRKKISGVKRVASRLGLLKSSDFVAAGDDPAAAADAAAGDSIGGSLPFGASLGSASGNGGDGLGSALAASSNRGPLRASPVLGSVSMSHLRLPISGTTTPPHDSAMNTRRSRCGEPSSSRPASPFTRSANSQAVDSSHERLTLETFEAASDALMRSIETAAADGATAAHGWAPSPSLSSSDDVPPPSRPLSRQPAGQAAVVGVVATGSGTGSSEASSPPQPPTHVSFSIQHAPAFSSADGGGSSGGESRRASLRPGRVVPVTPSGYASANGSSGGGGDGSGLRERSLLSGSPATFAAPLVLHQQHGDLPSLPSSSLIQLTPMSPLQPPPLQPPPIGATATRGFGSGSIESLMQEVDDMSMAAHESVL